MRMFGGMDPSLALFRQQATKTYEVQDTRPHTTGYMTSRTKQTTLLYDICLLMRTLPNARNLLDLNLLTT